MKKTCLNCRFYQRYGKRPGVCTNIQSPDFDKLVWDSKVSTGHWEQIPVKEEVAIKPDHSGLLQESRH